MRKRWTFEEGRSGFRYDDDAFRFTSEPRYARGEWDDGRLAMRLGGRDGADIESMSGGWTKAFELDDATRLTLSFKVKIVQGPDHGRKEYGDVRAALDGETLEVDGRAYLERLKGDGPGGDARGAGWQVFEIDLGRLAAGRHELTLGGYSNRKKTEDAFTEYLFDDVRLKGDASEEVELGKFEAEVLRLTNAFREQKGRDPLEADPNLTAAAEDWSDDMARKDFYRHSDTAEQIARFDYDASGWGENIAAGYPTPEEVVEGWINSEGHRRNLLRKDFEHIGIGHVHRSDDGGDVRYGHYWTQIFGAPDDDYLV